jgi:hypothetical protein
MKSRVADSRNQSAQRVMQTRIWLGVLIGSTIGAFIPDLWGAGVFSYASVLLSGLGGFAGIWLAYKIS